MAQKSKRERILEVAGSMFMERGFSAVSMEAIAAAAPVSKPTLYSHFQDKKALFAAVMEHRCHGMFDAMKGALRLDHTPEDVLMGLADQFLELILSDEAVAIHRVVVGESAQFPELGELFYRTGPARALGSLAQYFTALHKRGTLHIPEAEMAANFFLSMLKGHIHLQRLLGMRTKVSAEDRQRLATYSVGVFLKAHQPG